MTKNKKVNILGINLDKFKKNKILQKIDNFLKSDSFNYIVTPNPEIILEAQKNEEFFNVLNQADLSISDGIGLKFASWVLFSNLQRMTGADLTNLLLLYSSQNEIKIAIINWTNSLSTNETIESFLRKKYPDLKFIITNYERSEKINLEKIKNFSPEIAFVTLGAPYQEIFIYKEIRKIKSVRLAIGIGGSFDFLTKKINRAPNIFRKIGLEWLWRIFQEPKGRKIWRLKRIYNAVIVFTLKFLKWRFVLPFLYRKNVSCVVCKKTKNGIKIILAKRSDEKNHWQIIQGGIGKNTIKNAAVKEINEELNIKNFKVVKTTNFLYKYRFPENSVYRGGSYKRHSGYKGQKQALAIAEFFGNDEDIKINYWDHSSWKWVDVNDMIDIVHESRKKVTKIFYEIIKNEYEKN